MNPDELKRGAAEEAVKLVKEGMLVGLGTGTTANFAIEALGRRVKDGLKITGVPTSIATEKLARQQGIPMVSYEEFVRKKMKPDIDIDGADRVDPDSNLIKGGGGCHTREKVVAKASKNFVVIVDEGKLSKKLFTFPVAVEVVPNKVESVAKKLSKYGKTELRKRNDKVFVTDNSNNILDLTVSKLNSKPAELEVEINKIDGVVDNGVFALRKPDVIIVGCSDRTIKLALKKKGNR